MLDWFMDVHGQAILIRFYKIN